MIDLPALHIFLAHSGLIALWSRDIWKTYNLFISLFFIWCYYCCSTNIVYKKYIILWILDKIILTEFTDQCPCALQNKLILKPRCAIYEAMILEWTYHIHQTLLLSGPRFISFFDILNSSFCICLPHFVYIVFLKIPSIIRFLLSILCHLT